MKKTFLRLMIVTITIVLTIIQILFPQKVQAKKLVFQENFSNNLNQWKAMRNKKFLWNITDGQAVAFVQNPFTITELIPINWDNNWKNIEWDFDFITISGLDKNFSFGFQDLNNWYEIHFIGNTFQIIRIKNGNNAWSVFKPFNMENGKLYKIKLIFNRGNIKLYINNNLVADEVDPTFEKNYGSIGIKAGTGSVYPTKVAFDNIKVYDLDAEEDYFKQTDPQWAEKEYDHASKWSQNSTIGRWGCALTSMATLLRHYNITKLPPAGDSQERLEVTPETLNTWLKSQPDGYLGNGLLNWIAVTRLTRLINHYDQTPKLEYQYLPIKNQDHPYQEAIEELEADRWTLANIPGHFVAVHDTNADKTDLAIYDPYFDISWMSQHTSQNKPPKSYRKFVPSQTDLSYLLFAFPSDISVKILNDKNQDITDQYTYIEQINDPNDETNSTSIKLVSIPKPETSKFYLSVEAETAKLADITIFAYDDQANLTNLSQTDLPLGIRPIEFEIDYQKQASSQIKPVALDKKTLISIANDLAQDHQLPWKVNFWLTTYLSAWQTNQNTSLWPKYQTKVIDLIEWFKPDLDQVVYLYFKQAVKNLTSN